MLFSSRGLKVEYLIVVLLVVVICAIAFFKKGKKDSPEGFPYQSQEKLFSAAERSFYGVLCQAAADTAIVLGKVRVADVVKPAQGLDRSGWQRAFNRISAKHFDFVICAPEDLSVIAAIELDDGSHGKKKQVDRDRFLDGVCEAAGIRLHRFKASSGYNMAEIREVLFPGKGSDSLGQTLETANEISTQPAKVKELKQLCPKCSSELVRRVAKKGPQAGEEFLACSAFPKCRFILKQKDSV